MQCERLIGRLLAPTNLRHSLESLQTAAPFVIFRSSQEGAKPRRLSRIERLRCPTCGGNGIVQEFEQFATELIPHRDDDRPRGPGRRPKPATPRCDPRLAPFGLTNVREHRTAG
jgi:hypothetical protein